MIQLRAIAIIVAALLLSPAPASGAVIDVGNHSLLPNTPNQAIAIHVAGGELVAGADLFVQIGDGGPELTNVGLPAGTDAPEISAVDLTTGTIFGGSATQFDPDRSGVVQIFFSSVALALPPPAAQEVAASGLLATLTIDTSGFTSGTFDLALAGVLPSLSNGPFDTQLVASGGALVPTTILNGTFSIDPLACDFDSDGMCDNTDIDALGAVVIAGTNDLAFDLTGDMIVDNADRDEWLAVAGPVNGFSGPYKLGDANLDGIVDGVDFITWNNNKFAPVNQMTPWSDADWTFDAVVDGVDFLEWNSNKFTSSDFSAVPEPDGGLLCLWLSWLFLHKTRSGRGNESQLKVNSRGSGRGNESLQVSYYGRTRGLVHYPLRMRPYSRRCETILSNWSQKPGSNGRSSG